MTQVLHILQLLHKMSIFDWVFDYVVGVSSGIGDLVSKILFELNVYHCIDGLY